MEKIKYQAIPLPLPKIDRANLIAAGKDAVEARNLFGYESPEHKAATKQVRGITKFLRKTTGVTVERDMIVSSNGG